MNSPIQNWWERSGRFVAYPELRQGNENHCVYAAIAGAVNHLAHRQVWTPLQLFKEYQKGGLKEPTFGVSDTALQPVSGIIESHQHHRDTAAESLTAPLVRKWLAEGAVVIISMELGDGKGGRLGAWHMFSLMACDRDRFQVWDTNGGKVIGGVVFEGRGYLIDSEIRSGVVYPDGGFFMPHDKEDTLVLKRKQSRTAP